jgi:FlaA1/EpsC-like NDP-sugar epimerase
VSFRFFLDANAPTIFDYGIDAIMIRKASRAAKTLLSQRSFFVATLQSVLILFSLLSAWLLRFEFHLPYRNVLLISAPLLLAARFLAIYKFNLLHGWWRYTGVSDAVDIVKAVLAGSAIFLLVNRFLVGMTAFPLSIYALEALITGFLLAGVRLSSRIVAESVLQTSTSRPLILVGAGRTAHMLIREIKQPESEYSVVGCVDDDHSKRGLRILGVPVLGTVDMLPRLVREFGASEVLIAVPSATGSQMTRFVQICERAGVPFRTVPALRDLISGEITISQCREVAVEDLLGREPVQIDLDSVREQLHGKVVLVTGAAGSIGSELCRQILEYGPAKLVCVDHNETGIFYLERELSVRKYGANVQYFVADIRNVERMSKIMWECGVRAVFHAAAYKHVPVMESNVSEAVGNNVFGLVQLLEIAEDAECETFVLISSDKAVNPTSVMGCTKRVGELIMAAWPSSRMRCVSVRFGNVLGSSGSVIPVFKEQIQNGMPLTITHPEIERFFMTISEAVALVLQGSVIGEHRDILVLDMGQPVRIMDLANTLVRLSGKTANQVEFKFTGLRPGEKLYEELFYEDEREASTSCEKIKKTKGCVLPWDMLKRHLDELQSTLFVDGARPIRKKMCEIVPEYIQDDGTKSLASVQTSSVPVTHSTARLSSSGADLPN